MRRLLPFFLVWGMFLLDTSVIPIFAVHWAVPMLLLTTVIVLGLLLGRTNGLLYGMIGGLLMDIIVGYPLGMMAIAYAVLGWVAGFAGFRFQRYLLTVAITPAICLAAFELVMIGYAFLQGQTIDQSVFQYAGARVAIETVLAQVLFLLYNRMLKPTWSRYAAR